MNAYEASLLLLQKALLFYRGSLRSFIFVTLVTIAGPMHAQQVAAFEPPPLVDAPLPQGTQATQSSSQSSNQTGSITGTITDTDALVVPNATITVDGPSSADHRIVTSGQDGSFVVPGIRPGETYKVLIAAKGFADFIPPTVVLGPGQAYEIVNIKLALASVDTAITALTPEALAIEQETEEIHQRIFGVIPNFYVVYDHAFAPLSSQLKYRLAFKSSFDVVNVGAAFFLGAINQAADRPDYRQGLIGYGERVGAVYVDGVTDIIFGGAVLPALLHQDPRYFYEGTGSTKKKRFVHAIQTPFICKGDNGKEQINYSSIGGDLISGAFSNLYYPPHDRGVGLLLSTAAIATGGRMVNALAQEFVFLKFTSRGNHAPKQ